MLTQKSKKIKTFCAVFFATLGTLNVVGTGFNYAIGAIDWILLAVSFLPFWINNRGLLLVLGGIGMFVSICIGFMALLFSPELYASVSIFVYCSGFFLVFASLGASFGLVYSALQTDDKYAFSLI